MIEALALFPYQATHVARAKLMFMGGAEAEAAALYEYWIAGVTREMNDTMTRSFGGDTDRYLKRIEELQQLKRALEEEARHYQTTKVITPAADVTFPVWEPAHNAWYPELDSHGVYVDVHHREEARGWAEAWFVEVQILPPDEHRSQICPTKQFATLTEAEAFARKWHTIGRAVLRFTAGPHPKTAKKRRLKK